MCLHTLPYHLTPNDRHRCRRPSHRRPVALPNMTSHILDMPDIEAHNPPPPVPPKKPLSQRLHFRDQPSFRTFIRLCWLDILTQLLCTAVAFLLYRFAPPLAPKYFPIYGGMETGLVGMKYGKPYLKEYVNTTVSAVVSFLGPLVVILVVNLVWLKSFWEANSAIMGLGYALATSTLFQSILKILIGGLRPHFLTVCNPHPRHFELPFSAYGEGFGYIWHQARNPMDVCRGDPKQIREAQMSFPSGHSVAAFAGFGFLALWLNAKFNILGHPSQQTSTTPSDDNAVTNNNPYASNNAHFDFEEEPEKPYEKAGAQAPHWKLILFVLPWLIAAALAASKVIDYWHHWSDVIAGSMLGILMAHWAYRMVFRSVYDAKGNGVIREK